MSNFFAVYGIFITQKALCVMQSAFDTKFVGLSEYTAMLINLTVSLKKIGSDHHQWYRLFHIERIACLDTTLLSHPECIHA